MPNLFAGSIFSGPLVRALCWTLVHSCWQGLLLAMLTGLIIVLTRRSKPALRYNILSGMLCLFFLAACGTFVWELRSAPQAATERGDAGASVGLVDAPVLKEMTEVGAVQVVEPSTGWERMVRYFDGHAVLIVMIWFIVFMAKLVKILAQLGAVQRMRYYKVQAASEPWRERLGQLAEQLGVRKKVGLLESALVKVPMMAGVLKPVILIPLGLLSQLEPQQVEAILLHELAHIRRKDYLFNLIFSCTAILFFFNPAVWWIASLIREEREHCCDDMAVGVSSDKRAFISALVSFQEYSGQAVRYAPAFPGSGNHLLKRVKRIVGQDYKVLEIKEKLFLILCLVMLGGLVMAFSGGKGSKVDKALPAATMHAVLDTLPVTGKNKKDTLTAAAQRRAWEAWQKEQAAIAAQQHRLMEERIRLEKEQVDLSKRSEELAKEFHKIGVDGHLDEDNRWIMTYKQALEQQQLAEKAYKETGELNLEYKLQPDKQMDDADKQKLLQKLRLEDQERNLQKSYELKLQQDLLLKAEEEKDVQSQKQILLKVLDNYKLDLQQQDLALKEQQQDLQRNLTDLKRDTLKLKFKVDTARMKLKMDTLRLKLKKDSLRLKLKMAGNGDMHETVTDIIDDMLERHLIADKKVLSFSLDYEKLVINDVQQPQEMFVYFRDKYIRNPKNKILYYKGADGEERTTMSQTK